MPPKKPTTEPARLVECVYVGGILYGPGDELPPAVAEQITNPKAWAPRS